MEGWVLGQLAFAFTFYKVRPATVVDKLIEIVVDVIVPGRGAGESSWWMKGWRSLEQSAEKHAREIEIRSNLRLWDEEFPVLHHELMVRYVAGALASACVMSMYSSLRRENQSRR